MSTRRTRRLSLAAIPLALALTAFLAAQAPAAVNAEELLEHRSVSGSLLRPAFTEAEYQVSVKAALDGWSLGAFLGTEREMESPESLANFPFAADTSAPRFALKPPRELTPFIVFPLEALVRTGGQASPEDYRAVWEEHAAVSFEEAFKQKSRILSSALVLGLASPGMPELAARRVLDAFGQVCDEETIVPAIYVAGLASAACIDPDLRRVEYAAESQMPRPSELGNRTRDLERLQGRFNGFQVFQKGVHYSYGAKEPWDSPLLNLTSQLVVLDYAGTSAPSGLRYSLAMGYDSATNAACVLGLIGARCGPLTFPEIWRSSIPRGIQAVVRNARTFQVRQFPDDVTDASVTAEFPLDRIAEQLARIGTASLAAQGGKTIGQGPQSVCVLPWQPNLETNIRQLKHPIGREGERRQKENTPIADEFESRLRTIVEKALSADDDFSARDLGWEFLDLSAWTAKSRGKLIGNDSLRIADDWHRLMALTGARLAGWSIGISLSPETVAPGDKATMDINLVNQGRPLDEVTIEALVSGVKLEQTRAWPRRPLDTGARASASYDVTVEQTTRKGPLPARVDIRVVANGTKYWLPLPVEWQVVDPLVWESTLDWQPRKNVAFLDTLLLTQPDALQRDKVVVRVTGTPGDLKVEPQELYRPVPHNGNTHAGMEVSGITRDTTQAWFAFGLELECESYKHSATEIVQLGPIRQSDASLGIPERVTVDGRRSFKTDAGRRIAYEWRGISGETIPATPTLVLDYYRDEGELPSVKLSFENIKAAPPARALPLKPGKGWTSVTLPMEGVRWQGRRPKVIFSVEGQDWVTGRLRLKQ